MSQIIRSLGAHKGLAAALSILCLAGASPALTTAAAAGASGGTHYHDATHKDGRHVSIAFSRDGRRITHAFVSFLMKCGDGTVFTQSFTLGNVRVTSKGAFSAMHDTGPVSNETGSETDQWTVSLTGQRTRTRVSGAFRATLHHVTNATGATVACESGVTRYVAAD